VALNGGGEALTPALNVRDVIVPFFASKSQKIGQIACELTPPTSSPVSRSASTSEKMAFCPLQ
jgi:hypothetical protein